MSQHMLKAARLTVDMIERRNGLRLLLGDNYAAHVDVAKSLVRSVSLREGKSIVAAGLALCQEAIKGGHNAVSVLVAATVDLCEEADAAKEPVFQQQRSL